MRVYEFAMMLIVAGVATPICCLGVLLVYHILHMSRPDRRG